MSRFARQLQRRDVKPKKEGVFTLDEVVIRDGAGQPVGVKSPRQARRWRNARRGSK